jgi:hypothetical protein
MFSVLVICWSWWSPAVHSHGHHNVCATCFLPCHLTIHISSSSHNVSQDLCSKIQTFMFALCVDSGRHAPTLQLLGSWVQFWLFLADRYDHHLPNLSLPWAKDLGHLNTALLPKAYLPYACSLIWNVSLADLPNSWQNLTLSCYSNCDILNFCWSQTTALHTHTQLLFAGTREEWTRHHVCVHVYVHEINHHTNLQQDNFLFLLYMCQE